MYFGYITLASYPFVIAGFWIVMTVGAGFVLVYAVGAKGGKRAAEMWIRACGMLLVVASAIDVGWAMVSGQWGRFMANFGPQPLIEMALIGTLFVGSFWFMAIRYVQGLDK